MFLIILKIFFTSVIGKLSCCVPEGVVLCSVVGRENVPKTDTLWRLKSGIFGQTFENYLFFEKLKFAPKNPL